MDLRERAQQAVERDEIDRVPCDTKEAVLDLVRTGKADMMLVRTPEGWIETADFSMEHFAIRFHDRALGNEAREAFVDGFNLRDPLH